MLQENIIEFPLQALPTGQSADDAFDMLDSSLTGELDSSLPGYPDAITPSVEVKKQSTWRRLIPKAPVPHLDTHEEDKDNNTLSNRGQKKPRKPKERHSQTSRKASVSRYIGHSTVSW